MMESLFLKLLNMSITASYIAAAVFILRLVLKKAPKRLTCILWALVGIRLVCPFSFESIFSLIPSAETIPQDIVYSATPHIDSGFSYVNNTLNPIISSTLSPDAAESVNPMQVITFIISAVWLIGVAAMLIYTLISYLKIRNKVKESAPITDNIFKCDNIQTPFILGVIRPKIYLPSDISDSDVPYVLAHEKAHLKRHDHLWKPLGFILLSVYWFNPVLWAAYILLCRDIELACDEKVISESENEIKKQYSSALINCSIPRKVIAVCPLAFGESNIKTRVKKILNYKKPAFLIILIAVILCIAASVCLITNPASGKIRDEKLNVLVHSAIEDHHKSTLTQGSYICISTEVLKTSGMFNDKTVYLIVLYEEYVFDGQKLEVYNGSLTPTVIKAKKENGEYKLSEYLEPDNGSEYPNSINRMFPFYLRKYAQNAYLYADELSQNNLNNAKKYYGIKDSADSEQNIEYTTKAYQSNSGVEGFYNIVEQVCGNASNSDNMSAADAPQIEIDTDMNIYTWKGEELLTGSLYKSTSLSKANFDNLFIGNFEWTNELSIKEIKNKNYSSWYTDWTSGTNGTYPYMLLEQKDGTLYMVYADVSGGKATAIRWIYKLQKTSYKRPTLDEHGNPYFTAEILEIHDKTVLVRPDADTNEIRSSDKISVSLNVASGSSLPELHVGKKIIIVYDGIIAESYPAQINNVYFILDPDISWQTYLYVYDDSSDLFPKPSILLDRSNNSFSFTWSALSSYIAVGVYEEHDNQLILRTDDGKYTYIFDMIGEKAFSFNASKSSPIPKYKYSQDSDEPQESVPDGAIFTLSKA